MFGGQGRAEPLPKLLNQFVVQLRGVQSREVLGHQTATRAIREMPIELLNLIAR
jgi:hypothetical protein